MNWTETFEVGQTQAKANCDAEQNAGPRATDVAACARRIAEKIAAVYSEDVDRDSRFPVETIDALRSAGLLGALVPTALGGLGAGLDEVCDATFALATRCSSSAMIFAMHQLQVACLMRHGDTPALRKLLGDVASRQLLLASATTETGVGGKLRHSDCALALDGHEFRLEKQTGVISYGEYADAVLVTARRSAESASSDQVLIVCMAPGLSLTVTGDWNVLGMRGTRSLAFALRAHGDVDLILADPFADIVAETMMPVSHVLWAFVWLGIAAAAEARARRYVQLQARSNPGVALPGAARLAELTIVYEQMDALAKAGLGRELKAASGGRGSTADSIAFNSLKVAMSTMVVDAVGKALTICGMAGFREDTPYSLGRHLRDAHSAALMVNNDRLLSDNAQMLLIHREAKL